MKKVFYLLFAVSGYLFISYAQLTNVAVADFLDSLPPDRTDTADINESTVLDKIKECQKNSSDNICIYSTDFTQKDKKLLKDIVKKVFKINVIYI